MAIKLLDSVRACTLCTMFLLSRPSPRNNMWLRRNPWFDAELVPVLRERIAQVRGGS